MTEVADTILSDSDQAVWDADERQAWLPPSKLKPSEWAEKYRQLPAGQSDIPGPWRNDNAPYLRGIMDLCAAPGVVQLNLRKGAQLGVSEALRNVIGYWAHLDPDPIGLGLPDRVKGRKIIDNRVIPLFMSTDVLASLRTERLHDVQREQIKLLNGFILHLMWAGSPSATSSDPMRRVVNDEVDKPGFRDWGGAEPNPVGRTWKRLRTFGDRKLQVNVSTPTTRFGPIWRLEQGSDVQLQFKVPCPHCQVYQRLAFRQIKWPRYKVKDHIQLAARIVQDDAAWYECGHCSKRITKDQKLTMIRAGRWATEDDSIEDAEAISEWPRGTRIGMQISALYCLWESWSEIVAEFIRARHDRGAVYTFRTETLGEPFEEQMERTRPSVYSAKSERAKLKEGIVPSWAAKILVTIDTQHDHFYMVNRAWGPEMKSQRIWHGRVESFAELDALCFKHPWPVERGLFAPLVPELVLIDTGGTRLADEKASRTMEVYKWALRRRARVRPIKGASKIRREDIYIWPGKGFIDDGTQGRGKHKRPSLRIWFLHTHHFNDLLADLIDQGTDPDIEEPEIWLLNSRNDEQYNLQMSNVHKITSPKGATVEEVWVPVEPGARHDYRDCEVYQIAAAYMAHVHNLPSAEELQKFRQAAADEDRKRRESIGQRGATKGKAWTPTSLNQFL